MTLICRSICLVCLVAGLLPAAWISAQESTKTTKLLRFPDLHEDQIAFVYGGDLWRVAAEGGIASRITAHPGLEWFPKFSPDGKQVAFTGQYDGDEQVYVVESIGGVPRQLTFYPARGPLPDRWGTDNQVYGWAPDGSGILFRSLRHAWSLTDTRLYKVKPDGGLPAPLPMLVSGAGAYSPDGKKVVFSPLVRDFRTWKRYQGGWAQDLYIFDLTTNEYRQITDHPRSDRDPMWIGDRIYFSSDRTGTLNLFAFDLATNKTEQLTNSTKDDLRWPSQDAKRIVYEMAGELYVFEPSNNATTKVDVQVPTDGLGLRSRAVSADDYIEDTGLSPAAERVVVSARGDIFTVPAEHGPVRNLTRSSNAHDKNPAWSPDGLQIAYISDLDGEEELFLIDEKGKTPPVQITDGSAAMYLSPLWSPDGARIAIGNKDGKVFLIDPTSKEKREIADDKQGTVGDMSWSPCGTYLAFSMNDENEMSSLYIWSNLDNTLHRITDELFDETEPAWDPNGDYLYFLSEREFAPQISGNEWNYAQNRATMIYALALRKDVEHPFPPQSDEVNEKEDDDDQEEENEKDKKDSRKGKDAKEVEDEAEEDKAEDDADKVGDKDGKPENGAKEDKKKREPIKIDFDGLAARVTPVPVEADNIEGLSAIEGQLIYVRHGAFYYGRSGDRDAVIHRFDLKKREEETIAEDAGGYVLSGDGSKILIDGPKELLLKSPTDDDDGKEVDLSGMTVMVDPRQEFKQIFGEVWRRFRDYFYVENMHGYDWQMLRNQYEPLVEHVAHRSDLNYLIGEMIGELNVGHAYIAGGDTQPTKRADVALPGAVFELDAAAKRYRLAKIFTGDNAEPRYRSPLTETGMNVNRGDYILKIDGIDLTENQNPYELLRFKSKQPITFTVNARPEIDGSRDIIFNPIRDEADLIYLEMVLANRARVQAATNGEVGYLHIPDMSADGIREFNKWFYGQIRKKGLVIDVRSNGGGNVSQMIIERLRRQLLATGFARTSDQTSTYPDTVFVGHLVCLLDEDSASDGDIFPAMFRQAGLGPLIGKRSWGGVIGITNHGMLIDGGQVNVPEFGFGSAKGEWIIEGHGVDPDIVVENDPRSLIEGKDPQLQRGIEELLKRIAEEPRGLPSRPAPPVKVK
jgi:tricorn protease